MKIAVIDGQGGGIGRHITMALRSRLPEDVKIYGLGTNAIAMGAILKAGANEAATGENAIVYMAPRVDVIVGSIAVLVSGSMCGEVTSAMAAAVAESSARKVLLPINRNRITVIGNIAEPVPHQIEKLVDAVEEIYAERNIKKEVQNNV
ncbi:MAG: DUF3842 family protein [Firmicutes bacterium]|nr:DUF3842 family protein [Bacillota bacterium]